ncbi:MAG: SDR family oxidoreductase [Caulobacteraceae bacterium]|nr:SDR family oxidoreductase [Caulobacteraceae bacterium]
MSKLVLVTGAGRRVGAGIARRLARDGWIVGVHFNGSRDDAETVARDIRGEGGEAEIFGANLTDENAIDAMARALATRGDWVGLVNSAASFTPDTIDDFSLDAAQAQVRLNLLAPVYLSRKLREQIGAQRGFATNISDQKVLNQNPDFLSYTLAKTGLAHSTSALAMALAPNIRVNCIAAGLMLVSGDQKNFEAVHNDNLTRKGTRVEDVADAVAFLAKAENITGALIPVDGGQHLVPSARRYVRLASRRMLTATKPSPESTDGFFTVTSTQSARCDSDKQCPATLSASVSIKCAGSPRSPRMKRII